MEKYLKDTYGITVYQEQVMLLSRQLASFTRGESDALRKAMGKKKKAIVDAMKPKFLKQGAENGHDPKILEKIWGDWEKFASYAFNKSHATCYSWVAYQTAYLKAHYPAEFMSAIMTRRKDDIKEITKLMDECRSMKIPTLGPDVNESYENFGVNKKGEIRFGLAAIKGMGEAAATAIIKERQENGVFKDIFDFAERVDFRNVNRKAFESLAFSGGFDGFGLMREQYFEPSGKEDTFLDALVRYGQKFQEGEMEASNSLFGVGSIEIAKPIIPNAQPWNNIEKLNKERELVGIYLSAHPLDDYNIILKNLCNTPCADMKGRDTDLMEISKRVEITFGGIITEVKERFSSRTNKPFGIVTIEDYSGTGEFSLFDEAWTRWKGMLAKEYTVFITAKVIERFRGSGRMSLVIQNVQFLNDVKENHLEKFTISMDSDKINDTTVNDIMTVVNENPGKTQLFFSINSPEYKERILLRANGKEVNLNKNLMLFVDNNPDMDFRVN